MADTITVIVMSYKTKSQKLFGKEIFALHICNAMNKQILNNKWWWHSIHS